MRPNHGARALVVVYGLGSAGPVDLLRSAGDTPVLLLFDSSDPHTARVGPLLEFFDDRLDIAARDADAIVALIEPRRPSGVVTFSERMLPLTAVLASRLGLPGHRPASLEAVTDKAVQRRLLGESPRLAIRYALADAAAGAIHDVGLPAVAKPVRGEGSANVRFLHTPADVDAFRATQETLWSAPRDAQRGMSAMLVEEYLPDATHPASAAYGSYVSVEAFVVGGRFVPWAITDKLRLAYPFFECGSIAPSRLPAPMAATVRDVAAEAVGLLGIVTGTVHVEIKLTPSGPKVIEVNGRLGGSVAKLMTAVYGWDAVRGSMDVALDREPLLPVPMPLPSARCAVVVHVPATGPGQVPPRLRERVRGIDGLAAVDTAVDDRMLFGASTGGSLHRLVDLTVVGAEPAALWDSTAAAIGVLRDGGASVTNEFVHYIKELQAEEHP